MPDHSDGDVQNQRAAHDRPRVPADVIEGVRRRDREALGRFFDLLFPYVYRLAFRLTGQREAAEDLTQDVFLKVHRAAASLQPDRDPMPWLTAITCNACRDANRRAGARPQVVAGDDVVATVSSPAAGPDEAVVRKEKEQVIQNALLELDETSRVVVILHDYCGMSHEEAAVALHMRADGIRKRYSRALKRLASIIGSREL